MFEMLNNLKTETKRGRTKENARQVSCYVYFAILDSVCDLEVCLFLANTSAISMKSKQKSLPGGTIGSCAARKREK